MIPTLSQVFEEMLNHNCMVAKDSILLTGLLHYTNLQLNFGLLVHLGKVGYCEQWQIL